MTELRKTHEWVNGKQVVATLYWNGGAYWNMAGAGGCEVWLSDAGHGDQVFKQADAKVRKSFPHAKAREVEQP